VSAGSNVHPEKDGRRYVLEGVIGSIIDWAGEWGLLGLAVVSASEAAFQPAPPDLLVIPMVLGTDSSLDILAIVLVATLSSVVGAVGGYGIGAYAGRPILGRFASDATVARLDALMIRYGSAGIFIAAVSPIPYKALAWAAGAGRMDLRVFIVAGLFGRGIRFGMEGIVLGIWGDEFLNLLENPLAWLVGGLLGLLLFLPLMGWWTGLAEAADSE
jgi:membrane protein YqaA with SNARE-associated domain|tara:strand:+ start:393 stop:1037 length:645 start_codon:yes stop_codon:yes gene_type:complete